MLGGHLRLVVSIPLRQLDTASGLVDVFGAGRRLAKIPGIGPITASALMASISDARSFRNGRQLAAWLALVPRQHSSGGKLTLLGISKRGDRYLRTLLVHGARSVILLARKRGDDKGGWVKKLRHINIATVALAHKTVRTVGNVGP